MRQVIINLPVIFRLDLRKQEQPQRTKPILRAIFSSYHIFLWDLSKSSLAIYCSDLKSQNHKNLFSVSLPIPRLPSWLLQKTLLQSTMGNLIWNTSGCKETILSGQKRGEEKQRSRFSAGSFPSAVSKHKELGRHKAGNSWHYIRYLLHRWPKIGTAIPVQLSYCKLNSQTV